MGKVGIITYHDIDNYGAQLQAASLYSYLLSEGVDVEVINYKPIRSRVRIFGGFLKPALKLKFKLFFYCFKKYLVFRKSAQDLNLTVGDSIYFKWQLELKLKKMSCVICGSDEIWNFGNYLGFMPAYILDLHFKGKRISYAVSKGSYNLTQDIMLNMKNSLLKFSSILVRDTPTRVMVESLGYKAQEVVDPTFLISHSSETHKLPPYLMISGILGSKQIDEVKKLAKVFNLPIISPGYLYEGLESSYRSATAAEWVSYIYNSKFHVTSLFHGAALSMTNKVSFVVFLTPGKIEKISHMMTLFRIEERLLPKTAEYIEIAKVLQSPYPVGFDENFQSVVSRSQNLLLNSIKEN